MDKATLVSLDISEGSEVISALESHGIELGVALWMVTPEYEDGRLVIASKMLPLKDVLEDYEKVVRILRETSERTLPLFILRPDDPFVAALHRMFGNTRSVSGMRLGGQRIGNRYIEDAYVYKIA
jgi:hypothetical protein